MVTSRGPVTGHKTSSSKAPSYLSPDTTSLRPPRGTRVRACVRQEVRASRRMLSTDMSGRSSDHTTAASSPAEIFSLEMPIFIGSLGHNLGKKCACTHPVTGHYLRVLRTLAFRRAWREVGRDIGEAGSEIGLEYLPLQPARRRLQLWAASAPARNLSLTLMLPLR
jgi:hypothetical protein